MVHTHLLISLLLCMGSAVYNNQDETALMDPLSGWLQTLVHNLSSSYYVHLMH